MAKWRVAVQGSVGKSILIDDALPSQVAALTRQVSTLAAGGSTARHSALQGLQVGDDHPQYAMWQAEETIIAPWNFQAEPFIEGKLLTEFIQDVAGLETVQNTDSITWTYNDTAGTLEADVVPEFIQDTVGAMLLDTSTIDLSYSDLAGTITADVIDSSITYAKMQNVSATSRVLGRISSGAGVVEELTGANLMTILAAAGLGPANPSASVGLSAVNGAATSYMRSDAAPALDQSIAPTWTGFHTFTASPAIRFSNTDVLGFEFYETDAGADSKLWWFRANSSVWSVQTRTDAGGVGQNAFQLVRSGVTATAFLLPNDNQQLGIGAGNDLRLYHDGTDSYVRNDTGALLVSMAGTTRISVAQTGQVDINSTGSTNTLTLLQNTAATGASLLFTGQIGGINRFRFASDGASSSSFALRDDSASVDRLRINTNGNVELISDNQELRIGAGADLRLYHDGTNSYVRNDTGVLNVNQGATTVGRFDSSATANDTRFLLYDVTAGALVRVSRGASDSGGVGFRVLRIPN